MRFLPPIFIFASVLVAGCGTQSAPPPSPEARYVGNWLIADAPPKTGDAKKDAKLAALAATFIVEIHADKTWSLDAGPSKKKLGTYETLDSSLSLKFSAASSEADKKPITAKLSDDAQVLTLSLPDGSQPMKFKKITN